MKTVELKSLWDGQVQKYVAGDTGIQWPLPTEWLPPKGARILDAGCGAGEYLRLFAPISDERYGVDISPKMVAEASKYGQARVGDVRNLPYADAEFDYVLSILAISHCGDPQRALSELRRVCRPGGTLVLILPNRFSIFCPIRRIAVALGKYTLGDSDHFTQPRLIRDGKKLGLEVTGFALWNRPTLCETPIRQAVASFGNALDRALHALFPRTWGECLAVRYGRLT
jgi:SAM-dependent methyltransferase